MEGYFMKRNLFPATLLFFTCFTMRASAQIELPLEKVADVPLPCSDSIPKILSLRVTKKDGCFCRKQSRRC